MNAQSETIVIAGGARTAIGHIVQLYQTWGKPDQAAEWRKRLEELKTKHDEPKDSPKK